MASADAPTTDPLAALPASATHDRLRFTRDEYHRMSEVGLIRPDAKVELLDGEIFRMSPAGPLHSGVVSKLSHFFILRAGDRFDCRSQSPQNADDYSEPEPDLQLVAKREDFYTSAHPTAADAALVIEAALSSLTKDTVLKKRIYAAAGVPEYWVVDLVNRRLIVHLRPDREAADYREITEHDDTATVAPVAAADCRLELAWLFGPRNAEG